MTWKTIDQLEEIRLRMENAKSNGLTCKDIFIGDFEQIRHASDRPILVISIMKCLPRSACMPHGTKDTNTVRLAYIFSKLSDNNNKLYKSGDTTGVLYEIPKILNYMEVKRSDSSVDLTLLGTSESLPDPTIMFDYSKSDIVRVFIDYELRTTEYIRGER